MAIQHLQADITVTQATRKNKQTKDPRDVPNYTIAEVAYWLAIPQNTLRNWMIGKDRMKPVFEPASRIPMVLSFWNVVECSVLAAIRKNDVPLRNVRKALTFVQQAMGKMRPLIEQGFETSRRHLFVEHLGKLVCASQHGQLAMRELIDETLKRVEWDENGLAMRLSPWRVKPSEPQVVSMDPTVAFGKPVLMHTSVPASAVIERYIAGESMETLAEDFGVDRNLIEALMRSLVATEAA